MSMLQVRSVHLHEDQKEDLSGFDRAVIAVDETDGCPKGHSVYAEERTLGQKAHWPVLSIVHIALCHQKEAVVAAVVTDDAQMAIVVAEKAEAGLLSHQHLVQRV